MGTNNRSVGLSELASRAQSGAPSRSRSACRNPECRDGLTPGLVAAGGGTKGAPLFGAGGVGAKRLMRWAWIPCLACNAPDDARKAGAVYKHLNLSEGEIARRAQLANTKASYTPQEPKPRTTVPASAAHAVPPPAQDTKQLTELLEQNKQLNARIDEMLKQNAEMTQTLSRMSMQVAALLDDNAKLRAQATGLVHPGAVEATQRTSGTLSLPKKDTTT